MTWNLTIGGHNKVKAKRAVQSCERMPCYVKDAICKALDQLEDGVPFVINSAGHLDGAGGNMKLNVQTQHTIIVDNT